ncbi:MAG: hypothetical protein GY793_04620 [Proteobacteria bacterium]|nr:hypothetical protein [Pseudomonadota bacterium]
MHDFIVENVAALYSFGREALQYLALFMGLMAILWIFQLMKDPAKQFDLAMDLFKSIFVWIWKVILFIWMGVLFVFNMILRVVSVTFATVRDFFVSKN